MVSWPLIGVAELDRDAAGTPACAARWWSPSCRSFHGRGATIGGNSGLGRACPATSTSHHAARGRWPLRSFMEAQRGGCGGRQQRDLGNRGWWWSLQGTNVRGPIPSNRWMLGITWCPLPPSHTAAGRIDTQAQGQRPPLCAHPHSAAHSVLDAIEIDRAAARRAGRSVISTRPLGHVRFRSASGFGHRDVTRQLVMGHPGNSSMLRASPPFPPRWRGITP